MRVKLIPRSRDIKTWNVETTWLMLRSAQIARYLVRGALIKQSFVVSKLDIGFLLLLCAFAVMMIGLPLCEEQVAFKARGCACVERLLSCFSGLLFSCFSSLLFVFFFSFSFFFFFNEFRFLILAVGFGISDRFCPLGYNNMIMLSLFVVSWLSVLSSPDPLPQMAQKRGCSTVGPRDDPRDDDLIR